MYKIVNLKVQRGMLNKVVKNDDGNYETQSDTLTEDFIELVDKGYYVYSLKASGNGDVGNEAFILINGQIAQMSNTWFPIEYVYDNEYTITSIRFNNALFNGFISLVLRKD